VEVVASLCQGRTAAAQCGLFTYKSVPVIFEPPCIIISARKVQNRFVEKVAGKVNVYFNSIANLCSMSCSYV